MKITERLVSGAGRDAENERVVIIYCSRRPTDDEMRAIHDAARDAPPFDRSALTSLRRLS